jgi:hypothetical protein
MAIDQALLDHLSEVAGQTLETEVQLYQKGADFPFDCVCGSSICVSCLPQLDREVKGLGMCCG